MRSPNEHTKGLEDTSYRELRLLEEVDRSPNLSQRQLARRLGIALGVANLLVRSLASKGYIRVSQLGWRRWVYVVTPKGMARKVNLTLSYVERFFQHYRRVRLLLQEEISELPLNRESRVAIIGTSDMAELAYLALRDAGVDEIEVFERTPTSPSFLGMPVRELGAIEADSYAKVVIVDPEEADAVRDELAANGVSKAQVVELLQARRVGLAVDGAEGDAS